MATKIRLARHGAKGRPFYWVMVADARSPRETGKEKLGTYDPFSADPKSKFKISEDRVRHWLSCGAQPTDRVARLLSTVGLLPAVPHRDTPSQSMPRKKEQERRKAVQQSATSV